MVQNGNNSPDARKGSLKNTLLLQFGGMSLSAVANLSTVALSPRGRGEVVAIITCAIIGSVVGSFSLETFIATRSPEWLQSHILRSLVMISVSGAVLAAISASLLLPTSDFAQMGVTATGSAALTVTAVMSGFAVILRRLLALYICRALGSLVWLIGNCLILVGGNLVAIDWSVLWLIGQGVTALTLIPLVGGGLSHASVLPPPVAKLGLKRLFVLHLGILAQTAILRADQLFLAHFRPLSSLGTYGLAVSALETAQAPAAVITQRYLSSSHKMSRFDPGRLTLVRQRCLATAAMMSFSAVVGLLVLSFIRPAYSSSAVLGILLIPGMIALAGSKPMAAAVVVHRSETAATVLALSGTLVTGFGYFVMISRYGATGAAIVSSAAYTTLYVVNRRLTNALPPT